MPPAAPVPTGKNWATGSTTAPLPAVPLPLDRCARAHAWLNGKDFVSPDNVQAIAHDVLRHRIIPSYEAEAEGVTTDHIIDQLLARVAVS